jgi:hypothetical protein
MVTRMAMVLGLMAVLQGCGSSPTAPTLDPDPVPVSGPSAQQPVYVVLFTHIEDNTPAGEIGSGVGRSNYARMRQGLIDMATLARRYNVKWSLQPDWKFLLAAQAYEDAAMTASTGGKNVCATCATRSARPSIRTRMRMAATTTPTSRIYSTNSASAAAR